MRTMPLKNGAQRVTGATASSAATCSVRAMGLRAFPVLYASDVEAVAQFYVGLGFQEHFRLAADDGSVGYVGLRRDDAELAVTTENSPRPLVGIEPGPGPRHELFVYVDDVDRAVSELRSQGVSVLREPDDMFWGERLAWVSDPEGNVVSLATAA
jgi:lactoylglutathione lyase